MTMLLRALPVLLLVAGSACAGPMADQPSSPPLGLGGGQLQEVRVVDQAGFDELRSSGKFTISEPRGEVSATLPCESGGDEKCTEAARQRLRETAKQRGSNLVLVKRAVARQTYPVQYSINGVLYLITPR